VTDNGQEDGEETDKTLTKLPNYAVSESRVADGLNEEELRADAGALKGRGGDRHGVTASQLKPDTSLTNANVFELVQHAAVGSSYTIDSLEFAAGDMHVTKARCLHEGLQTVAEAALVKCAVKATHKTKSE
jgi:hypothetical protein